MPATGALVEMAAECGSTTSPNGQQPFDVLPPEPVAISFEESISRGADQIGHLEWWPGHLLFLRRTAFERQRIQWTRGRDRKSTRLNSSHTVISYAVFCLKKKKTKQNRARRGPREHPCAADGDNRDHAGVSQMSRAVICDGPSQLQIACRLRSVAKLATYH